MTTTMEKGIYINEMDSIIVNEVMDMYNRRDFSNCEHIGEGSTASVYLYKEFAIKVYEGTSRYRDIYNKDGEVLKYLEDFKGVVKGYFYMPGEFVIMECLNGTTLDKLDCITEEMVKKVCDIYTSLIYAGVYPEDLKKDNIMCVNGDPIFIDVGGYSIFSKEKKDFVMERLGKSELFYIQRWAKKDII